MSTNINCFLIRKRLPLSSFQKILLINTLEVQTFRYRLLDAILYNSDSDFFITPFLFRSLANTIRRSYMYQFAQSLIIEKDIARKVSLLEFLTNSDIVTVKEIADQIGVSPRTISSDIQSLRDSLPEGWQIDSLGNSGIKLSRQAEVPISSLWEDLVEQSISFQLLKFLFRGHKQASSALAAELGTSTESLRRLITFLNKKLSPYQLKILTKNQVTLVGSEADIRIFYHRLLLPFTHANFFFDDYPIHESFYHQFLRALDRDQIGPSVESIWGICWYFINTIRIKANCRIDIDDTHINDPLFQLFSPYLTQLYHQEGIYLDGEEGFFAFYCFIESWNFSEVPPIKTETFVRQHYRELQQSCDVIVGQLATELRVELTQTFFSKNLLLLFLKYTESISLSEKFVLAHLEVLNYGKHNYASYWQLLANHLAASPFYQTLVYPEHFISSAVLLLAEAISQESRARRHIYFTYQGEPAWKSYLANELNAIFGGRISLASVEMEELLRKQLDEEDIIVTNHPIDQALINKVFYISTIPTKSEINSIKEHFAHLYFSGL